MKYEITEEGSGVRIRIFDSKNRSKEFFLARINTMERLRNFMDSLTEQQYEDWLKKK